jgi:tripartite-type tricarboxylate transporter receptor subunit TctC
VTLRHLLLSVRLSINLTAAALPVASRIGYALDYPKEPVRLLLGFAPGGAPDILARLMGQWLSERLGQPIVVENKPGGSGRIPAEAAVKAPGDGYTLLMVGLTDAVNAVDSTNASPLFARAPCRSRQGNDERPEPYID